MVMRRLRARVTSAAIVAGSIIAACKYTAPDSATDGNTGVDMLIEPPACVAEVHECLGTGTIPTQLHECSGANATPMETACPWGCIEVGSAAHCAVLQPSGNGVIPTDLDPDPALGDVTLAGGDDDDIHGDGVIDNHRTSTTDGSVEGGIKFFKRNGIAVYIVNKLTITGTVQLKGTSPIALVALGGITIDAVDAQGGCSGSSATAGGFDGGDAGQDGEGDDNTGGSRGTGTADDSSGGGGGAFGGSGGSGGRSATQTARSGGSAFGTAVIAVLRGGGGGGGGSGSNGGVGGGGGGALQLVSNGPIVITGGINAGGCAGKLGATKSSGGGGGAGGAILIEGPTIQLGSGAFLTVNGGAGASGDGNGTGQDGRTDAQRATANNPGGDGGRGGDGGAGSDYAGGDGGGINSGNSNGGGGGGGVGWLRLNTLAGSATIDPTAIVSPLSISGSTTSQGSGVTQ